MQQQLEQLQAEKDKFKATEQIETDVVLLDKKSEQEQTEQLPTTVVASDGTATAETRTVLDAAPVAVKSGKKHKSNTKKANSGANNKNKLKSSLKDAAGDSQKAEGTLSGLASLKRVGNVRVTTDPEGHNSTIKAKFTLGPLVLRVEKSIKRAGVENVKSATARTNEMIGRIKFGVVNDRATLMSIKVQQPKQVGNNWNINNN